MATEETAEPPPDPDQHARRLAGQALAAGEPTGWFEPLYAAAEAGRAVVPWDRGIPQQLLVAWADTTGLDGAGRRALIVGCGLGEDAEFVATFGFDTVAFDVSASAIRAARRRFPGSAVDYVTADLLDPPAAWRYAFDLVVESMTLGPCQIRRGATQSRTSATWWPPAGRSWLSRAPAMRTAIPTMGRRGR